ncbi:MAG: T9SS type A sorting domain-containing protein [Bacteroidetes bacterium]|nr:T9SS type A sorting domain-containing protein [Bacteroidota bacterium]
MNLTSTKKLVQLLLVLFPLFSFADWQSTNTGFLDNFNSVKFKNTSTGMIAGNQGIYYTTNGVSGTWTKFIINNNSVDSLMYSRTQFNDISYFAGPDDFYFCGTDTVQNKAIILKIKGSTLNYTFEFIGPANSSLNKICVSNLHYLISVGNNGFIVAQLSTSTYTIISNIDTNNLYSVSLAVSGDYVIGGDQIYYRGKISTGALNETKVTRPLDFMRDATFNSNNNTFYGSGNFYETINFSGVISTYSHFDFGPLNATGITLGSGGKYVSTDHGIFYSSGFSTFQLEYQPSSNATNLNDINFLSSSSNEGFACGDNGTLLFTTNGAASKPYAYCVHNNGACVGNNVFFQAFPGSGTSCVWKVGSTTVSTTCTSYNFTNTSIPGNYTVNYIVTNSFGLSDTFSANFFIQMPPLTSGLIVTLTDSLLCKKEPAIFTIQNTQVGYNYLLRNTLDYYGYIPGNGGTVTLISDSGLFTSTEYTISIASQISSCYSGLSKKHTITVEDVNSNFHSSLTNAEQGELVVLNAITKDAQNFSWNFQPGASLTTSNIKSPTVSFSNIGLSQVELISWSNNGCYDTATISGPNIIPSQTFVDPCFIQRIDCTDMTQGNSAYDRINILKPFHDAMLIGGSANKDSLMSRYGATPTRRTFGGAYLANYSKNGTFRWRITGRQIGFNDSEDQYFQDVTFDSGKNIFAVGHSTNLGVFTDNTGETYSPGMGTTVGIPTSRVNFLSKFDSIGRHLWSNQFFYLSIVNVRCDKNNDVILGGGFTSNTLQYYSNSGVDTVAALTGNTLKKDMLVKTNNNGEIIWSIYFDSGYGIGVQAIELDSSNNIYVLGGYDSYANIYSPNNDTLIAATITYPGNSGGDLGQYIIKFDPNGNLLWYVKTKITTIQSYINRMATDVNGNSYITGVNHIYLPTDSIIITDAGGSNTSSKAGTIFLAKISSIGNLEWIYGRTPANNDHTADALWADENEILLYSRISALNINWGFTLSTANGPFTFPQIYSQYNLMTFNPQGALTKYMFFGDNSTGFNISRNGGFNITKDNDGYIYSSMQVKSPYSNPPFTIFGIPQITNGEDAIWAKIGGSSCTGITGLNSISPTSKENIIPFPNPTSGEISLNTKILSGEFQLEIYSSNGQCIHSSLRNPGMLKLNLNEFTKNQGLYVLSMYDKKNHYTSRIMLIND